MRLSNSSRVKIVASPLASASWMMAAVIALLACTGIVRAQAIISDSHLVSCGNQEKGGPPALNYLMNVNLDGMQSSVPLMSFDGGVTVTVNDWEGNSATVDCRVGCIQTTGTGSCAPVSFDAGLYSFGVQCATGPLAGQVWAASFGAHANPTCQATIVNGTTTGWTCTISNGSNTESYAFDCTKGCNVPGTCKCIGGDCPAAKP
jgi:hypothetical protein